MEDMFYMYSNEKPLWARCGLCGELNIISDVRVSYCDNCKTNLNEYMRELTEDEIKSHVKIIGGYI